MTSDLFALTGTRPALGRDFRPEDEKPGAPSVVVLSDQLWHERFSGDPAILGNTVRVAGEPSTVIGVMPPGFRFPLNQFFWQPLRMDAAEKNEYQLQVVGLLKPGGSPERARSEMRGLAGAREGVAAVVEPYLEGYVDRELRSRQLLMLAAGIGLLLIACVNVANLVLARAAERTPEVAVRTALGAGRWRVVFQLLTETLVLAALGGALGLGLARGALAVYRRWLGDDIPSFWVDVRLDARVFLFALGITLLAGIIAGSIPALQAARTAPGEILKDQSRGATSLRLGRFARVLCVAEIALSCGLLVPTGLTLKSLANLGAIPLSFPADRVLTANLSFYGSGYDEDEARLRRYYADLGARAAALPGVEKVAFTSRLPLGRAATTYFEVEGRGYAREEDRPEARWAAVTPGYFEIFGLRRVDGRLLTDADIPEALPAVVVNRSFAERIFPGESPIGRRVRTGRTGPGGPSSGWSRTSRWEVWRTPTRPRPPCISPWPRGRTPAARSSCGRRGRLPRGSRRSSVGRPRPSIPRCRCGPWTRCRRTSARWRGRTPGPAWSSASSAAWPCSSPCWGSTASWPSRSPGGRGRSGCAWLSAPRGGTCGGWS